MSVRLDRIALVNPNVKAWGSLRSDTPVPFMPLEAVWPAPRGDFSRTARKTEVDTGYTRFERGDILLPKITPTFEAGRSVVADIPAQIGAGTTELHIIRPFAEKSDARFLAYLFRSSGFLQEGASTMLGVGNLRRVTIEFVRKFKVEILDVEKQKLIADYLDSETSQLDSLIEKTQAFIRISEERKSALIEECLKVTVGKEDNFKYVQMKHLITIYSGKSPESVQDDEGEYIVYGSGGAFDRASKFMLEGKGVLFGRKGTIDRPQMIEGRFWVADTAYCAFAKEEVDIRFIYYLAKIFPYDLYATSTALPSMTRFDIGSHKVFIPEIDEQRQIADRLDSEIARIDLLISKQRRQIELLKERRSALITQAVTKGI